MIQRRAVGMIVALVAVTWSAAGAAGSPPAAAASTNGAVQFRSAASDAASPTAGPLPRNLLFNPGAQAGAYSAAGWDAVTIPGWRTIAGLPTVVRYGTGAFPRATGRQPAVRDGQLFTGGAGGTARLEQFIRLRSVAGRQLPAGTRFQLSGWLGGNRRSNATLTATFITARGAVVGHASIGPVGGHRSGPEFARRAARGLLPAGTASVRVTLVLATAAKNNDGPYAPVVGYNTAVADGLVFTVSARVQPRVPARPAAHVPRYQHVFLFYFENEDYGAVIGNKKQAPFLNSLLAQASVLADFYAEEHPSDGNYLALAGGSAFGVPLDDPLEENPRYTIRARNISDLVDAAQETWKGYLQSANGPCDDTVHGHYWDDDMPMTYFADVRDRPAFCAAHLLPLQALASDLASAATTPNFAWVSPDDCADMEGCGIAAGDDFLAAELGAIMRSPAWRTQRSLAIITFDEDGFDNEHPAQRVATVMIGSAGVRHGYVSRARYTHYSLLATIEAALGLGRLTANDRYAEPVSDMFGHGAPAFPARLAAIRPRQPKRVPARRAGPSRAAAAQAAERFARVSAAPKQPTAFVVNSASDTVTPVDLITHRAGKAIKVGHDPQAVAITPDGAMAYVVNSGSGTVTPIATATRKAGPPIRVGADPQAVAITPDGDTAFVTNMGSDTVTPVDLRTDQPGLPIAVGAMPRAIAITPDGQVAFVLNWGGGSVTPIRLASGHRAYPLGQAREFGRPARPIPVGGYPYAIAIGANGAAAYVASYGADTVTGIDAVRLRATRPVRVGQAPDALAVTPDGATILAVNGDSDTATVITGPASLAPSAARHAAPLIVGASRTINVGYSPAAVAMTAAGQTAFVVNTISGTLTPITVATGKAGKPISVGQYAYPTLMVTAPSEPTAVVVSPYAGQVTLVDMLARRAIATVTVGNYPVAAAIAP